MEVCVMLLFHCEGRPVEVIEVHKLKLILKYMPNKNTSMSSTSTNALLRLKY